MPHNLDEKQIARLKQLLSLLEPDAVTKKDFDQAVEAILKLVVKREEMISQAVSMMQKTFEAALGKVQDDHSTNYSALRGQVNELFVSDQLKKMDGESKKAVQDACGKMMDMCDEKMAEMNKEIESKMKTVKDGAPGPKGDTGPMGPMPTEHLEMMEKMKSEMEKIKDILKNIPRGNAVGRAKSQIIRRIDLTSQVDGGTSVFTLAPDVVDILAVFSTQFPGGAWRPGVDWTFSGRTLTLETAQVGVPQNGQTLWILAEVLFYP